MFNQLFQLPKVSKRYLNAPFLEDRLRYLTHRAKQEMTRAVLREIAYYQLGIIKYLRLKNNNQIVTLKELETAAKRWARHQKERMKIKGVPCAESKIRFISQAKRWLSFVGRLEIQKEPLLPTQVIEFIDYMRKEQNLSEKTISVRHFYLQKFFNQTKEKPDRFLAHLTPAQLDAIQIQQLQVGIYSRGTIRLRGSILRIFFRYAERKGWCRPGLANSILSPRNYTQATLPLSPSWEDVQRLLKTTEGDHPSNIRDRAMILLLAVYGLRAGEVRHLCIDDFDWEQRIFYLKRSKQRAIQQFPITQTVERALLRYLKEVRPQHSIYSEVFLTVKAPYRPPKSIFDNISLRWKSLKIGIKSYGPHSLRHACATRLINQGVPLKIIADQLGHRNLDTTRIYAKVDLSTLREVANFNMGGLL